MHLFTALFTTASDSEGLTKGLSGIGSELDSVFCIVGSVTPIGLPLSSSKTFNGDLALNSGSICEAVASETLSPGISSWV